MKSFNIYFVGYYKLYRRAENWSLKRVDKLRIVWTLRFSGLRFLLNFIAVLRFPSIFKRFCSLTSAHGFFGFQNFFKLHVFAVVSRFPIRPLRPHFFYVELIFNPLFMYYICFLEDTGAHERKKEGKGQRVVVKWDSGIINISIYFFFQRAR